MPSICRSMKGDLDGFPTVEDSARGLGVRGPASPHGDVDLDPSGNVLLNLRGMSVAQHWRDLPRHRIPERLDDGEIGAIGPNSDRCWRMGEGRFLPGPIASNLSLALKSHDPKRGNVVPNALISLDEFRVRLATMRSHWVVDEA